MNFNFLNYDPSASWPLKFPGNFKWLIFLEFEHNPFSTFQHIKTISVKCLTASSSVSHSQNDMHYMNSRCMNGMSSCNSFCNIVQLFPTLPVENVALHPFTCILCLVNWCESLMEQKEGGKSWRIYCKQCYSNN